MKFTLSQDVRISPLAEWGLAYAFVRSTNKLWVLNRTTWYVLKALSDGAEVRDVVSDFKRTFGIPASQARSDVKSAIDSLRRQCIILPG